MADYTYKDVIIDPEDPRVKVGAKYYFSDSPINIVIYANADNKNWLGTLDSVKASGDYRFSVQGEVYACLIRKKELSYAERQEKWIKENDIKKGDKVRIVRQAYDNENGWDNFWAEDMDEAVGKVGTVSYISIVARESGIEIDVPDVGGFNYPYFVLEKVEQKYVPFDLSKEEDRAKLRGAWIKFKSNPECEYEIYGVNTYGVYAYADEYTPDYLLEYCLFVDGTPCGKLGVEE